MNETSCNPVLNDIEWAVEELKTGNGESAWFYIGRAYSTLARMQSSFEEQVGETNDS